MVGEAHVGIRLEAGARGYLLAHDDVGLEVEQVVDLALDGGLGQHASGTDERSAGEPGVDGAGHLEGAQDDRLGLRRGAASQRDVAHGVSEDVAVDVLTQQVRGVTGVGDLDATQHLTCDDLDVLVVQVDALAGVDVLDGLDEGVLV